MREFHEGEEGKEMKPLKLREPGRVEEGVECGTRAGGGENGEPS